MLAALLLLFIGWLLANLVRTGVMKLLDMLRFDSLAEKTGIEAFLKQGNSISPCRASWPSWRTGSSSSSSSSPWQQPRPAHGGRPFQQDRALHPQCHRRHTGTGVRVLVARFINRLVFAYLNNMGVQGALTISTLSEYGVIIFVVFVALEQLAIAPPADGRLPDRLRRDRPGVRAGLRTGRREWAAGVIRKLTEK